jgi:hypothetical protein
VQQSKIPHVVHCTPDELLARVLAALRVDGGSYRADLDADVAALLGHGVHFSAARFTGDTFPVIEWRMPHSYAGMTEPCPKFSSSVDAVLLLFGGTLAHGKLRVGYSWSLEGGSHGPSAATVTVVRKDPGAQDTFTARARGPAAALCGAAIQAILAALGDAGMTPTAW